MATATFDYAEMAAVADELILEFGMWASLVRGGVYRDARVVVTEYMPRDPATQLANPTERQIFISAGLGGIPGSPPDWEQDQLVTYVQPATVPPVVKEVLAFTMPVKLTSPAGIVCVYQATVKR